MREVVDEQQQPQPQQMQHWMGEVVEALKKRRMERIMTTILRLAGMLSSSAKLGLGAKVDMIWIND